MTVTLTGTDGLFTRLGKNFYVAKLTEAHQVTLAAEIQDAIDEYAKADMDMAAPLIGSEDAAGRACAQVFANLQGAAHKTIIEMVNDDVTLPSLDITTAMKELIRQMVVSGDDVESNTIDVGTTSADAANTGTGIVIATSISSTVGSLDSLQRIIPENIRFTCTQDAQERGTEGRETFAVKGEANVANTRDPNWPQGSGISVTLRVSDPAESQQNQAGRNLLNNSAFENFTSDAPDNWILNTGVATTDFDDQTSTVFRGSKCLEFIGDGAILHDTSQAFDTAGQTTGKLKPETTYIVSYKIRASAAPASGVWKLSVKDGSDAVLYGGNATDVIPAANIDHLAWESQSFSFSTGVDLPTGTKVVAEFTTALETGKSIYLDDLIVTEVVRPDPMGPGFIIVPGQTAFVRDDRITLQVTNDDSGEFQKYFDRIVGIRDLGMQIPYASSPSIADTLIS